MSFTRSDTRIRNSPKSSVSSGIPSCPGGGKKHTDVTAGAETKEAELGGQATYVVGVELAVSGQAVEEPLYVRPEDAVTSCVVDLVQMFSQSVPEVEGDLHHLARGQDTTSQPRQEALFQPGPLCVRSSHQWAWRRAWPATTSCCR